MREERIEDIHINFRNEYEIKVLINSLKHTWDEIGITKTGIKLLIILENSIGLHDTENYIKENPTMVTYPEIIKAIND